MRNIELLHEILYVHHVAYVFFSSSILMGGGVNLISYDTIQTDVLIFDIFSFVSIVISFNDAYSFI